MSFKKLLQAPKTTSLNYEDVFENINISMRFPFLKQNRKTAIIVGLLLITVSQLYFFLSPQTTYAYNQCNYNSSTGSGFAPLSFSVTPSSGDANTAFKVTIHWSALQKQDPLAISQYNQNTPQLHILVLDYRGNVLKNPQAVDSSTQRNGQDRSYALQGIPQSDNFYSVVLSPDYPSANYCVVGHQDAALLVGAPVPSVSGTPSSACAPGKAAQNSRCVAGIDGCTNPNDTDKVCAPGLVCDTIPGDQGAQGVCQPPNITVSLTCPGVDTPCSGPSDTTSCQKSGCPTQNLRCVHLHDNKYACEGADVSGVPVLGSPPPPPCVTTDAQGRCVAVATALSVISGQGTSTDPVKFINQIFQVLLGVGGGIAVLLIMFAGYRLMVSQGKPEAIQQAREQLIAAIVGILFIVFSIVILEAIGVDLLHIPGLTK